MCSCSSSNMAGLTRADMLKYGRRSCWISAVLLMLAARAVAQTDASNVQTVADANWTLILHDEWMIKFYAPWCPACQHLQTDWENLGRQSESLGISVGRVDVTQQPALKMAISANMFHHGLLRISRRMLCRKSGRWLSRCQDGGRHPLFCKYNLFYLMNTLGIPSWGSYVIFAIITLFMGLMLGLMLVLIADCIWPSRPKHRENKTVVIVKEEVSEEEVEDILMEEKHASDLDNESERVSGDDSTEEEGAMSDEDAGSDQPPSEGAAESSVRKRKPQEQNTTEGT
ncbi:thioredoxin-related transmembrane protein 4 isoform X2 [Sinocyclocheilus grahami]|uniref:thioredoxin-related transmembrane protein 4 isoform X2 n=1 Tax=Sinocyclocheilus grahami TaxID=75366 RepID=UPI0007AD1B41|nr:PREDICTED: thioredoxin-related transmembrane protein 4-like isoform X2 [Sinocyclocheilus grahami]